MIYISSTGIDSEKISCSVEILAKNGFKNIELSGGTNHYDQIQDDLNDLKINYELQFRCHNYFPPPKSHFVLNLGSDQNKIFNKSLEIIKNSMALSDDWNSKKYGFHAGFMINPKVSELGKKISYIDLTTKKKAIERFKQGLEHISSWEFATAPYVENNVFSYANSKIYIEQNPFLLCTYDDYMELQKIVKFNLLLDVAHLKVSCATLCIPFLKELEKLLPYSNYLHLSDNDSRSDSNWAITSSTDYLDVLRGNLKDKDVTLEIYEDLEQIKKTHDIISELMV